MTDVIGSSLEAALSVSSVKVGDAPVVDVPATTTPSIAEGVQPVVQKFLVL
jgi:hypothetical protein